MAVMALRKREGRRDKGYGGACVPCLGIVVEEEREQCLKQQRQRELRSESMAAMAMAPTAAERRRARACTRENEE